jgi:hypothetical protein
MPAAGPAPLSVIMVRSRHRLTATVEREVLAFIRAGGFPHQAAEAAGIPREVFERWLRQGQSPGGPKCYRDFYQAVLQARAQARLKAEVAALSDRPLDWLRSGPGKETADSPGWTAPVRARPAERQPEANPLLDPAFQAFIQALLAALEPFPAARAAAAELVARMPGRR